MEVGEYVRTKYQGIKKINKIFENATIYKYGYEFDDYEYETIRTDEIIKSSPNIIDLIEVGDYVNGQKVHKNDEYDYLYLIAIDGDGNYYEDSIRDIKSIVTKEQFEAIKYEIK